MKTPWQPSRFWIGNGILVVAMLMLFYMGPLSEALGFWAAVLWMVVAAVGMGFLMSDKSEPPPPG
ncbi:MAG: hypothetical protein LDL19_07850 [Thiobacillus sp.]|nr:hypothetical protein [Thiobacillus sp.]